MKKKQCWKCENNKGWLTSMCHWLKLTNLPKVCIRVLDSLGCKVFRYLFISAQRNIHKEMSSAFNLQWNFERKEKKWLRNKRALLTLSVKRAETSTHNEAFKTCTRWWMEAVFKLPWKLEKPDDILVARWRGVAFLAIILNSLLIIGVFFVWSWY